MQITSVMKKFIKKKKKKIQHKMKRWKLCDVFLKEIERYVEEIS